MRNAALHARFGAATATRGTAVECSEGDDKDEFVTPSKRSADDRKETDHAVQSSLEFETPVKGPKQVPKLLPRPAGARPGVQKPPDDGSTEALGADDDTMALHADGDSKEAVDATDGTSLHGATPVIGPRQVPKLPPRPTSERSGCPRFVKDEDGEERAVRSLTGRLLTVQQTRQL